MGIGGALMAGAHVECGMKVAWLAEAREGATSRADSTTASAASLGAICRVDGT
jgi:hypothetical protein